MRVLTHLMLNFLSVDISQGTVIARWTLCLAISIHAAPSTPTFSNINFNIFRPCVLTVTFISHTEFHWIICNYPCFFEVIAKVSNNCYWGLTNFWTMWHFLSTAAVRTLLERQSIGLTNYHQYIFKNHQQRQYFVCKNPTFFWVLMGLHQPLPVFTFFYKKSPNKTDWGRNM